MTKINGKTTLTFDVEEYIKLLTQYPVKIIKNEAENEKALVWVEELMHKKERSTEENELYELLIILVEKFEQEFYKPGQSSSPSSLLGFLMKQQDITENDLGKMIGSQAVITEILKGDRNITEAEALALGEFFSVEPNLFL